jgi:hypothetical protein
VVQNERDSEIVIASIGVSGSAAGEFGVVGGDCQPGVRLQQWDACTVEISFEPEVAGIRRARIDVTAQTETAGRSIHGTGGFPRPDQDTIPENPTVTE